MTREEKTVKAMIGIYCSGQHRSRADLCKGCRHLLDYSVERLRRCPHHQDKPTCAHCATHCYQPRMREKIRDVMRYSGPRMLFRHPVLALFHFLDGFKKAPARPSGNNP
jgi:hypothetical protein